MMNVITLIVSIDILTEGLELAKKDGILYLGTCNPDFRDNGTIIEQNNNSVFEYRRGVYFCTHGVAYTKRRAKTLWGEMSAYRFLHSEIGADTIAREWQIRSNTFPISIAQNIHWPPGSAHYGLFYQDRDRFSSTMR